MIPLFFLHIYIKKIFLNNKINIITKALYREHLYLKYFFQGRKKKKKKKKKKMKRRIPLSKKILT